MNDKWKNWLIALGVVVAVAGGVWGANSKPTTTTTTTTSTSTTSTSTTTSTTEAATTTTTPPRGALERWDVPEADNTCERLNAVTAGETIWLEDGHLADVTAGGTSKDFACDVRGQKAPGVTVTGSWTGDLWCHGCDGWLFDQITAAPGSLRMLGGRDWKIQNAVIHGGNRGLMAVVGTGADDGVSTPSPYRWQMVNVDAGGAGCRPAGDPYPTHVRALYVNGKNGAPNEAFITGSRFWGAACGYTAKIGTTGNFGVSSTSADAADGVTFTGNVVEQTTDELPAGVPRQDTPMLVSGNSDQVTVTGNTFTGPGPFALSVSGPFTGRGFVFTDNRISQRSMIQWRRYKPSPLFPVTADHPLAYLGGEQFVAYPLGPCPPLGTCAGNS